VSIHEWLLTDEVSSMLDDDDMDEVESADDDDESSAVARVAILSSLINLWMVWLLLLEDGVGVMLGSRISCY
jgi:hypothetical protein